MLGVVIDPFISAAIVLTVYNTIVVSGIIEDALLKFPRQYVVVAKLHGISGSLMLKKIILPIVLRQVAAPLLISQIVALQTTLFASLISVEEIFRSAQRINAIEYRPVEIYSALALFYIIASFPIYALSAYLDQRYSRNLSEN